MIVSYRFFDSNHGWAGSRQQISRIDFGDAAAAHEPEPAVGFAGRVDLIEWRTGESVLGVVHLVKHTTGRRRHSLGDVVTRKSHDPPIETEPQVTRRVLEDRPHALPRKTVRRADCGDSSVGEAAQTLARAKPDRTVVVLEHVVQGHVRG